MIYQRIVGIPFLSLPPPPDALVAVWVGFNRNKDLLKVGEEDGTSRKMGPWHWAFSFALRIRSNLCRLNEAIWLVRHEHYALCC